MKKITIILTIFAFFALSCNQPTRNQAKTTKNEIVVEQNYGLQQLEEKIFCEIVPENKETDDLSQFPLIGNTIGFVVLDWNKVYEDFDASNKIKVLNDDGSIWHSNIFTFDEEFYNELFRPWVWAPEFGGFVMRCIAKSENYYTIVVNEEKNLVKRLRKHNHLLFQTVEEHVLNALVATDFDINPIRKYPCDDAQIIEISSYDFVLSVLFSIERNGDWIKIRDVFGGEAFGWIRWRKGDRFMVQLQYSI